MFVVNLLSSFCLPHNQCNDFYFSTADGQITFEIPHKIPRFTPLLLLILNMLSIESLVYHKRRKLFTLRVIQPMGSLYISNLPKELLLHYISFYICLRILICQYTDEDELYKVAIYKRGHISSFTVYKPMILCL